TGDFLLCARSSRQSRGTRGGMAADCGGFVTGRPDAATVAVAVAAFPAASGASPKRHLARLGYGAPASRILIMLHDPLRRFAATLALVSIMTAVSACGGAQARK